MVDKMKKVKVMNIKPIKISKSNSFKRKSRKSNPGFRVPKANVIKSYKPKPIKKIWINEKHDTDGDGVPNFRDCVPWDPRRQHLNRQMRKEVEGMPIYIEGRHISTNRKHLPRESRQLKNQFFSVVRRRPDVVTSMKGKDVQYNIKPFGETTHYEGGLYGFYEPKKKKQKAQVTMFMGSTERLVPTTDSIDYGPWVADLEPERRKRVEVLLAHGWSLDDVYQMSDEEMDSEIQENALDEDTSSLYSVKEVSRSVPDTIHHELQHHKQHTTHSKKEVEKMFEGPYWDQPGEVEAREVAEQKEKEFYERGEVEPEDYEMFD